MNVKALPGLNKIEPGDKAWTIGAMSPSPNSKTTPSSSKTFPGLQQAAAEVGSQQIRNVATVGGNLAQHSRCWYFRHRDTLCLKKDGDMCYARHGENRYHSLFTGNTCISPVVSNLAVALAALDATVVVLSAAARKRRLSMAELYANAWDNPTAHNSLDPGDLILQVEIPVAEPPQRLSAGQREGRISIGRWSVAPRRPRWTARNSARSRSRWAPFLPCRIR